MIRKKKSKAAMTRDLHDARALTLTQATQINGLMVSVSRQRGKYIDMIKQVLAREIEIGRLNGYIEGMRENKAPASAVVSATAPRGIPMDQFDLSAMRERLAHAPQADFDRMVDQMDDDTLERVTRPR